MGLLKFPGNLQNKTDHMLPCLAAYYVFVSPKCNYASSVGSYTSFRVTNFVSLMVEINKWKFMYNGSPVYKSNSSNSYCGQYFTELQLYVGM